MPDTLQEASALIDLLNAWAKIDISLKPAAIVACTAPALPQEDAALWSLLPEKHREFFEDIAIETHRNAPVHHNTDGYDPTHLCVYHFHPKDDPQTHQARQAARHFFQGRHIDVIEGHGAYHGAYEFEFDFAIALATKDGLIFSFVWNLQD